MFTVNVNSISVRQCAFPSEYSFSSIRATERGRDRQARLTDSKPRGGLGTVAPLETEVAIQATLNDSKADRECEYMPDMPEH